MSFQILVGFNLAWSIIFYLLVKICLDCIIMNDIYRNSDERKIEIYILIKTEYFNFV